MKKAIIITIIFSLSLAYLGVAQAGMLIPNSDRAKERAKAPKKSPVITDGWELERVDFIHYVKPDNPGSGKPDKPGKPDKGDSCFKLMGVKWKSLPVSYVINPTNNDGLSENFVAQTISSSAETWDNATTAELLNDSYSIDYSQEYGDQNYVNAIDFGPLASGTIGITSVWYTPRGKQIVEFDIRLNDSYVWGDALISSSTMDLANIMTHELGHAVGMDDIYSGTCTEVTMYGYSDNGETKKRDLEPADIEGIQSMYGI